MANLFFGTVIEAGGAGNGADRVHGVAFQDGAAEPLALCEWDYVAAQATPNQFNDWSTSVLEMRCAQCDAQQYRRFGL